MMVSNEMLKEHTEITKNKIKEQKEKLLQIKEENKELSETQVKQMDSLIFRFDYVLNAEYSVMRQLLFNTMNVELEMLNNDYNRFLNRL